MSEKGAQVTDESEASLDAGTETTDEEVIVFGAMSTRGGPGGKARKTVGGRKSTRSKRGLRAKRTPASLKRQARKRKLPTKAGIARGRKRG